MSTDTPPQQRTDVDKAFVGNATYRSLGEQQLSAAEERFEKARRTVGFFLAPLVTLFFWFLPLNLEGQQQNLAAIMLGVVILWITEPVPIPIGGFIGIAAIVLTGTVDADTALAPFGSSTVFTFIGAFILAQAMLKHGLAKRFAMFVLSLPGVGSSTTRLVIAFGAVTALLSAFVSNTATVAMLLPTGIGILTVIAKLLQDKGEVAADFDPLRLRVGAALMLMLAYGASVGGLLTPVGSPPNLIGRDLIEQATGERISFVDWMVMAAPICALMFIALTVILLLLNKPEIRRIQGVEEYVRRERQALGGLSRAERNTLVAFAVTVTLWITPGIVALAAGTESGSYETVSARLDEGVVAVLGASLLFACRRLEGPRVHPALELTQPRSTGARWCSSAPASSSAPCCRKPASAKTIGESAFDALGLSSAWTSPPSPSSWPSWCRRRRAIPPRRLWSVPIVLALAVSADVNPFVLRSPLLRGLVRFHAAGLYTAERDRLRFPAS
jgi:sodium-dependent dicarboxylate transporter 2/3/5